MIEPISEEDSKGENFDDEANEDYKSYKYTVGFYEIYMLGLSLLIGGQTITWNIANAYGFYVYISSLLFMASGYICLVYCLAEMASKMPFSGGTYGWARAALGPLAGFIFGCLEALQNIVTVSAATLTLCSMIVYAFNLPLDYQPVYWLVFYVIFIVIHSIGGRIFWWAICTLTTASLLFYLIYILGTASDMNFDK